MPDWLELATLNLPGRQARFAEPARTNLAMLTAELVSYCASLTEPYLFFGYCTGALLAHSVACGLQRIGVPMPRLLGVGSYLAPHRRAGAALASLDSASFWQVLLDNYAVPPLLKDRPDLRAMSESVIRADIALLDGYQPSKLPTLKIPITVLAGEQDSWLAADDAAEWDRYTTGEFSVRRLHGGHWFMEEDVAAAATALVSLAEAAFRPGRTRSG